MKDKKLLVLTEGSKSIGLGHINRINNLLTAFREKNINIHWYINGGEVLKLDIEDKIEFINWDNDDILNHFVKFDYIIIDTYLVKKEFLKKVVNLNRKILFIIDSKLHYVDSDVNKKVFVLFSSAYATKEMVSEKVNFIGGKDFLLFNDSFYKIDSSNYKKSKEYFKIIINIGGFYDGSFVNEILKIIDVLYSDIHVDLLGLPKQRHYKMYESKCNNIFQKKFLKDMEYVKVLNESDLIISNGGQSLNDAMFLGKPTLVIIFADNQLKNANYWHNLKLAHVLGDKDDPYLMHKIEDELKKSNYINEFKSQKKSLKVEFPRDIKERILNIFLNNKN